MKWAYLKPIGLCLPQPRVSDLMLGDPFKSQLSTRPMERTK
jgi:hypothetical protein